jgi:hemerythrin
MGFLWRDSYSIGNAGIDSEHQRMFELANEFFGATDRLKRTDCAVRLFEVTRAHFDHEEQWMCEMDYPEISAHVQQHYHLLDTLKVVTEKVAKDTLPPSALKAFLSALLLGHIVTFDAKLSAFLHQKDAPKA